MYGNMLVEVQGPLLIFPQGDPLPLSGRLSFMNEKAADWGSQGSNCL